MPGVVRASFGLYNTLEEVDVFADALHQVANGRYAGEYHQDVASGDFIPRGWQPDFAERFSFDNYVN